MPNMFQFSLHWLNNKEIYFSMEAEKILQELAKVGGNSKYWHHVSYNFYGVPIQYLHS